MMHHLCIMQKLEFLWITAVDITKETADIILLEKNLDVLTDGVVEGRKTFGNLQNI